MWTEKGSSASHVRVMDRSRVVRTFIVPSSYPTFITVSGRYANFYDQRPWLIDIVTGQYVPLTVAYGGADLAGSLLGVYPYEGDKTAPSIARILDLSTVPALPNCGAR